MRRRSFIKQAGAAAVLSQTAISWTRMNPTTNPLRIAVVGLGGRGKSLVGAVKKAKDCQLVALADVDEQVLAKVEKDNNQLLRTNDFRKILERKDVDAIVSATPNHWHALLTVLACQAGKHVYIEKPISHNMFECTAINAAADRYKKLVQCGFQNRSDSGLVSFFAGLKRGDFGEIKSVLGTCHRKRDSIGRRSSPLMPPKHIDFDLWLGPADEQKIMRPNLHYDWHWDFNTGNGDVGNQGPHEWDMINWALGSTDLLPTKMVAAGNRFGWDDAGNTPNVLACAGVCRDIPIYFEVMDLNPGTRAPHGNGVGVIIETDQGRFVGWRGGGRFEHDRGIVENFKRDESQKNQDGTFSHLQNFVDSVLKNDRSSLRSDCTVAGVSSSMAHMANISYQTGSAKTDEEVEDVFAKTEIGKRMLERLRESIDIYSRQNPNAPDRKWVLGKSLEFNNESNNFVGENAEKANEKMSRNYRSVYQFPPIG